MIMDKAYFDLMCSIERLNKLVLDSIDTELGKMGLDEVSAIQALLLYKIGNQTMPIGEISSRGYYLGTNISYNLKKLIKSGYIKQTEADYDKRSSIVELTEKGLDFCNSLKKVFSTHINTIKSEKIDANSILSNFRRLEMFFGRLAISGVKSF